MSKEVSVFDAAVYILKHTGPLSAMKLQKLVYYAQAWSLVWDDRRLFKEPVEAWANGPVVPKLYKVHKGKFEVTSSDFAHLGDASKLDREQRETASAIIKHYGKLTGWQLSKLTHQEAPWRDARKGLDPNERSNQEITVDAMYAHYASLG